MGIYTIGLLDCEIDVRISSADELKSYTEDSRVLYIVDENGKEIFFDKARTFSAIMEL